MMKPPDLKNLGFWNMCALGLLAFGIGSWKGDDLYEMMFRGLLEYRNSKHPELVVERTPDEELHQRYTDLAIEHVTMLELPSAWGKASKRTMNMMLVEEGCIANAHYDGELVAQVWIPKDQTYCEAKRYE